MLIVTYQKQRNQAIYLQGAQPSFYCATTYPQIGNHFNKSHLKNYAPFIGMIQAWQARGTRRLLEHQDFFPVNKVSGVN